jgi:hypothetical protein
MCWCWKLLITSIWETGLYVCGVCHVQLQNSCKVRSNRSKLWRYIVGAGVYLHLFLTWAVDGGEWSTSRPGRFNPGEKTDCWRTPEPVWTIIIIIIIIIIINCKWVDSRWQWSCYILHMHGLWRLITLNLVMGGLHGKHVRRREISLAPIEIFLVFTFIASLHKPNPEPSGT